MVQVSGILINDHHNDMHHDSSYVEFTDIYHSHVFQRTQLPSMGCRVQVSNDLFSCDIYHVQLLGTM